MSSGICRKFDDCRDCRFRRRRPDICGECDSGEMFEEITEAPLDFTGGRIYSVSERLLTDDDHVPTRHQLERAATGTEEDDEEA